MGEESTNSFLKRYEKEEAQPKPKATINSYRSFGYNLQTAIADIIDNSISAKSKNIWLEYVWEGKDSYMMIADDGIGMDLGELIEAMTPGSKDPDLERNSQDLGRFGLGLKTASFSQCKRLTVCTKILNGSVIKRCWDLDYVNEVQKWRLLDYISSESFLNKLTRQKTGTVVIWERLDRIVGNSNKENEVIRKIFLEEFNLVEKHLGMVFHKYLDKKGNHKIKIYLNGHSIEGWDPFLLKHSEIAGTETFDGGKVRVQCFVLPHMSKFKNDVEREAAGGPKGWYEQQGFYIYRNDRMLVVGDWLNFFPRNEHSKLARISIDFTNNLDQEWSLDIKKSTARPPSHIRKDLERLAKKTRKESGRVYGYRGTILKRDPNHPDFEFEKIWDAVKSQDGSIDYKLNVQHALLKKYLNQKVISQKELKNLIRVVEDNIPIETIIYHQSEDPGLHELRRGGKELTEMVIELARDIYDSLLAQGIKRDLALKQLLNIEPFNQYDQLTAYFL